MRVFIRVWEEFPKGKLLLLLLLLLPLLSVPCWRAPPDFVSGAVRCFAGCTCRCAVPARGCARARLRAHAARCRRVRQYSPRACATLLSGA